MKFYLCCLKRADQPPGTEPSFHFHEVNPHQTYKPHECETCSPNDGKIYGVIELAQEGARAKVVKDFERYRKVRPILIEHRIAVETELKKVSKG